MSERERRRYTVETYAHGWRIVDRQTGLPVTEPQVYADALEAAESQRSAWEYVDEYRESASRNRIEWAKEKARAEAAEARVRELEAALSDVVPWLSSVDLLGTAGASTRKEQARLRKRLADDEAELARVASVAEALLATRQDAAPEGERR